MFIYRLHRKNRAAADYGGTLVIAQRWSPAGVGMLYCASSLSLAVLEILVHTDKTNIPDDYVSSIASVDSLEPLGVNTDHIYDLNYTRSVGSQWVRDSLGVGIMVPSVIVPTEMNVLLNPAHEHYSAVRWEGPAPFAFDPRLFAYNPIETVTL
jgi:RES domain-containing protein